MDDLENPPPPSAPAGPGSSLVDRVKAILLNPKEEWPRIADEPATIGGIYRSYVIPLAAIPPVAMFIGMTLFGMNLGFVSVRLPIAFTLVQAIVQYGLGLVLVYALSLIINALAPNFGGTKNPVAAFKVAAYSATAGWIAGIINLFPALGILAIIGGLYSLYLFWLGLPPLMRVPEDKAVGYTAVVIVVAIVLSLMIGVIVSTVTRPMMGYTATSVVGGDAGTISVPGVGSVDLGKMEAASKQMQAEVAAAQAGTTKAVPGDQLQAMLPAAVAGFARTGISSASMGAGGLGGSNAEGTYKNGDKEIRLEVTDLGAAAGIAALGSAFNVNESRQDENGYEKTANVDGRMTTEKWDKGAGSGEYGVLVAKHFMVKASGQAPIETLKQAVGSIDFAKLEALAKG
jgi:hypothetical protein